MTEDSSNKQNKHARLREESKTVERVVLALQNRLDEIRLRGDMDRFTLSDEERKRLWEFNNSGLLKGVALGAVSFVALRFIRSSLLKRMNQRARLHWQQQQQQQQQKGPATNSPFASPSSSSSSPHVQNSPFTTPLPPPGVPPHMVQQQQQQRASSKLMGALGWCVDALVSFSIAVTGSVYFTDVPGIMRGLAEFPKLPGGSKVADEFCPTVLHELEKMHREQQQQQEEEAEQQGDSEGTLFHNDGNDSLLSDPTLWKGQPVQSVYLQSILRFAENCRATDHSSSPDNNNNKSSDFYEGDDGASQQQDWADAMTSDQEDR